MSFGPELFLCFFVFGLWWLYVTDVLGLGGLGWANNVQHALDATPLRGDLSWPLATVSNPTCDTGCTTPERKKRDDLEEILGLFCQFTVAFRPVFSRWILGLKMFEDTDATGLTTCTSKMIWRTFSWLHSLHFTPSSDGEGQVLCVYI